MMVRLGDYGWDLGRGFLALDALSREIDRAANGRSTTTPWQDARGLSRVELHDEGEALVFRAEVPGYEKDEIEVSLEDDALSIRGAQRTPTEGEAAIRHSRPALRFARSFTLPIRVDAEKAEATLRNGILELRLPKLVEAKARRIEVKAA